MIRATAGCGVSGTRCDRRGAAIESGRPPPSHEGQAAMRSTGSTRGAVGLRIVEIGSRARYGERARRHPQASDHAPRRGDMPRRLAGAVSMRAIPLVGDDHAEQTVANFGRVRALRGNAARPSSAAAIPRRAGGTACHRAETADRGRRVFEHRQRSE